MSDNNTMTSYTGQGENGMQGAFWSNTVWYLALLAITVAMVAVVQAKADNRRFITAFMAAVLGLFYLFDYGLAAVLDAYIYLPKIVLDDPFQDSVFGNIFSQTSIVASCALIIVLRLKPWWYFVIAAAYYLVELLFVWLGIFTLHWYMSIYTPIIMVPLFWAIRRWHNHAAMAESRESANTLLFLGALALAGNSTFLPLKLMKIHLFTGHFFDDPSRDHTTTLVLYLFIFVGVMIMIYRARLHLHWKALMLTGVYLMQYAAFKAGLMTFREGWFIWVTLLEIGVCLLWINVLDRLIKTRRPTADGRAK